MTRLESGLMLLIVTAGCGRAPTPPASGGDPERGKAAIITLGCGSCHVIPGIARARGMVGPPLDHMAARSFIAGEVPNTPAYMVKWIMTPQSIEPGTAMPNLDVSESQARDIVAFLYTLR